MKKQVLIVSMLLGLMLPMAGHGCNTTTVPESETNSGVAENKQEKLTASIICGARCMHKEAIFVEDDWAWHSKMMEYGQNLDSIEYAERLNTYDNQPGMNHLAFVSATIAWLKLVGTLKEAVELSKEEWMKEAYKQDYQIWLELERDMLAMNVENYSAWPQDAYNVSRWLAELRRELMEEEILYLKGEERCYWRASAHPFCFDNSEWILEKWFKSRMEAAEKFEKELNATDFRKMTNKIAYMYKKKKRDLEWYSIVDDD